MKKTIVGLLAIAAIALGSCKKDDTSTPTLSNADKVVAVINSLETGNTQPGTDYISSTKFINHNMSSIDGQANFLSFIAQTKASGTTVSVKRVLTEGNYVFTHSEYLLFGQKMVGFDVFKVENGLITEHWDNLQPTSAANASGHTMIDGPINNSGNSATVESAKLLVKNFINDVIIGLDSLKIPNYIEGDNYIQHNPLGYDGKAGLESVVAMSKAGFFKINEIKYAYSDGNFVLVLSEGTMQGKLTGFYDLFRIENNKIVEHWDVLQQIPTTTAEGLNPANTAGKW